MGNTKFDKILGLLEPLETDSVGEWIIDKEHKGTEDDPIHFPYPKYTEVVNELIDAVYEFEHENPEYELKKYGETHGAGSTFIEISGRELAKAPLKLPALKEQKKIGGLLHQVDELISLQQQKLAKYQSIKKSLLQQMFM